MQCPYCGYEYDDKEPRCPFCATENTGAARKQQQSVLRTLEDETEDIRRMPEKMLSQANRKTAAAFGGILTILILLIILVIAGSFTFRFFQSHSTSRNLKRLEACLQEKDYNRLLELMNHIDSYEPVYSKYSEIADTYRYMSYLENDLEWFYESRDNPYSTDENTAIALSYAMGDCLDTLSTGRQYMEDGLIQDNEDALENICSQAEDTLTLTFQLTEEEIRELLDMELYYYDSDSVLPYAELVLKRME